MARKKSRLPKKPGKKSIKKRWPPADLLSLKKDAGRLSIKELQKKYKRTDQALRNKASTEGISLRMRAKPKSKRS